ncbi:hypothetical protein ACHHYP_07296 [Achlya hypogyna]|uniref:Myb/SANT-like domain-containing protein n=1 Tax=Achlya hypogyna TaxID=1202772 RepID=A0A1V9YR77_ACHHY|nr:hypothetical protein ACHHYP_07296 [Achlya hypogyna]
MSRKWMTDDENLTLCKAWVSASENAASGTGMKYTALWEAISAAFKTLAPAGTPDRSARSLETKFSLIKHDTAKFSGLYAQILDLKQSGTNLDDIEAAALRLYSKLQEKNDVKGKKA